MPGPPVILWSVIPIDTTVAAGRFQNGFRRSQITYPFGKVVSYNYDGDTADRLNRTSKLSSDINNGDLYDVAQYEKSGSGVLTCSPHGPTIRVAAHW